MPDPRELEQLMAQAVSQGVAPAISLSLWREGEPVLETAAGAARVDTVFDLASLTKPLAGGFVAWDLARRDLLAWDAALGDILGQATPADKTAVTPRQLLCHAAGFPPHRPYFTLLEQKPEIMRPGLLKAMLLNEPLDHPPGTRALYSDLGYMVLGLVLEAVGGSPLDDLYRRACADLGLAENPLFAPLSQPLPWDLGRVAPCGPLPGRPKVHGQVEDENAFALGGVAAHAGLFGTAHQVGAQINALAGAPGAEVLFALDQDSPGSHRTPGFDTPEGPDSAAGPNAPAGTVGHLGFTGVSLWWHRTSASGVVLLTNRVALGRDNWGIKQFRPRLHEAAWRYLGF